MDARSERGIAAAGLVVGVAVIVLVAAVSFVLLTKRAGDDAAGANAAALDEAAAASDEQAQSSLRNGIAAARTAFTDFDSYGEVTPEMLGQIEPSFEFVAGSSSGPSEIAVAVTDQRIGLALRSESGTCWVIRDDAASGMVTYGSGGEPCTGEAALATATLTTW